MGTPRKDRNRIWINTTDSHQLGSTRRGRPKPWNKGASNTNSTDILNKRTMCHTVKSDRSKVPWQFFWHHIHVATPFIEGSSQSINCRRLCQETKLYVSEDFVGVEMLEDRAVDDLLKKLASDGLIDCCQSWGLVWFCLRITSLLGAENYGNWRS